MLKKCILSLLVVLGSFLFIGCQQAHLDALNSGMNTYQQERTSPSSKSPGAIMLGL